MTGCPRTAVPGERRRRRGEPRAASLAMRLHDPANALPGRVTGRMTSGDPQ